MPLCRSVRPSVADYKERATYGDRPYHLFSSRPKTREASAKTQEEELEDVETKDVGISGEAKAKEEAKTAAKSRNVRFKDNSKNLANAKLRPQPHSCVDGKS